MTSQVFTKEIAPKIMKKESQCLDNTLLVLKWNNCFLLISMKQYAIKDAYSPILNFLTFLSVCLPKASDAF